MNESIRHFFGTLVYYLLLILKTIMVAKYCAPQCCDCEANAKDGTSLLIFGIASKYSECSYCSSGLQ